MACPMLLSDFDIQEGVLGDVIRVPGTDRTSKNQLAFVQADGFRVHVAAQDIRFQFDIPQDRSKGNDALAYISERTKRLTWPCRMLDEAMHFRRSGSVVGLLETAHESPTTCEHHFVAAPRRPRGARIARRHRLGLLLGVGRRVLALQCDQIWLRTFPELFQRLRIVHSWRSCGMAPAVSARHIKPSSEVGAYGQDDACRSDCQRQRS